MKERFLPMTGMAVVCPGPPTDAEALAVGRFVREVERITGVVLPVRWGPTDAARSSILVGNRASLPQRFAQGTYELPADRQSEDMTRQSYVVDAGARGSVVLAAGFGDSRTARGHLGTGYALGELLRRLDLRNGRWGWTLPGKPIVATPRVPQRTLYVMNSDHRNPGLSLEYFNDAEMDDYVDRLVEARYSRVCFFQWSAMYLYPGNADDRRAENQRVHRVMRRFFDRASKRGLEVWHQLTPAHATVELLPNEPRFKATGYYGWTSVCWSQPEARDLARKMAQTEMEYYGPMDGYMVWFYDPGGCFCEECAAHQSERIFDQLVTVVDLAKTISPGAQFQAGLWPTWGFAREKERIGYPGRGYTEEDVQSFVRDFLRRCLDRFGPRNLTIIDSCEGDETNIYNGLVQASQFKRSGFMYTVLGMASELAYPFASFRLRYLAEQMSKARDRGLEESQLFIQYSATNFPGVFAFADMLYEPASTFDDTVRRLAMTLAKGASREPFLAYLIALEDLYAAQDAAAVEGALKRIEEAAERTAAAPGFVGSREWLKGHTLAQRWYVKLAQASDKAEFDALVAALKERLAEIPMYRDYASRTLSPDLARHHVGAYWRAVSGK